ncbi:MAG TPA: putative phage tail protein [Syntrophomonadaceae bacterium]|nr:putative phage tail protein [Syntrophomonadaceae bacterium]
MKSVAGQEIMVMLPAYYTEGANAPAVIDTWGAEFDAEKALMLFIIDQLFATSASAWGLDYWEEDLGLVSYPGKPDDQRRSVILSKLLGVGTVTLYMIKIVANSYENGAVEIDNHPETYSFIVRFMDVMGIPPNLTDLQNTIEEIKPAHLAVIYEFKYLTYDGLKASGHTYDQLVAHALIYNDLMTWEPV